MARAILKAVDQNLQSNSSFLSSGNDERKLLQTALHILNMRDSNAMLVISYFISKTTQEVVTNRNETVCRVNLTKEGNK